MMANQQVTERNALVISPYFSRAAWASRLAGALLLLVAVPVVLALLALVRATSRGNALYRQERSGIGGRPFWMYKIRTMYHDAEKIRGPVWSKPGDSRITPVGRVLRFLHFDELPQLWNIARGEMAFIGPRPERPSIVERLADSIPGYTDRLQVLPGVTGLAQINLPPDETDECVRRKLVLDRKYIAMASPGLDARILVCTGLRMLGIRHGMAARLMGVRYHVPKDTEGSDEAKKYAGCRRSEASKTPASSRDVVLLGAAKGKFAATNGADDAADTGFGVGQLADFAEEASDNLVGSGSGAMRRPK